MNGENIKLSDTTKKKLEELGVAVIYLFGSRANGTNLVFSDLDLGIVVSDPEKRLVNMRDFFLKVYRIITEDIPDGYKQPKLDISFLQRANPALGMKAVKEGKVIMEADSKRRADFEENILKLYNDYLPLKREYEEANIKAFS
jgi:hypothetical protein